MSYNPQQPDPKRLEELLKQQPQITKEIQQTIEHINQKIEKIKDERSKETIKKYWQPVIDSLITLNKHIQTMTTHITQLPRIGAENLWQDIWNTGLSITQTAVDIYYHIKYILPEIAYILQSQEIKEFIVQTYILLKQLYTLTVCPWTASIVAEFSQVPQHPLHKRLMMTAETYIKNTWLFLEKEEKAPPPRTETVTS